SDGVLAGLDMAGLVDWSRITNGYVGCLCPWEDQHTGIKDDRAGYNPDSRHFMCFHGSHGPKGVGDLDEWLRENVGPQYIEMRFAMARGVFEGKPIEPIELPDSAPDKPKRADLISIAKAPPPKAPPARRAICSHLARGEVT